MFGSKEEVDTQKRYIREQGSKLRAIDNNHELLRFVDINESSEPAVKSEFLKRFTNDSGDIVITLDNFLSAIDDALEEAWENAEKLLAAAESAEETESVITPA